MPAEVSKSAKSSSAEVSKSATISVPCAKSSPSEAFSVSTLGGDFVQVTSEGGHTVLTGPGGPRDEPHVDAAALRRVAGVAPRVSSLDFSLFRWDNMVAFFGGYKNNNDNNNQPTTLGDGGESDIEVENG